jgi:putative glutathione S-transferase
MGGLGPADRAGNYRRPVSALADPIPLPDAAEDRDRFVLVVGRSCPWAHRTWLVWSLRRLQDRITLRMAVPDLQGGRWLLDPPLEGHRTLAGLYRACGTRQQRATVPLLLDRMEGRILGNESARLVDLLNLWPAPAGAPDLDPAGVRERSRRWREQLQNSLNDGVYRCGFARSQEAYGRAEEALTRAIRQLEEHLAVSGGPWLCGSLLSLADLCLFPTLIRWELVYAPLFGCGRTPLWSLPHLHAWRRRLHGLPEVAATCDGEAWRQQYYRALFPLNAGGIVPAAPPLARLVAGPSESVPSE